MQDWPLTSVQFLLLGTVLLTAAAMACSASFLFLFERCRAADPARIPHFIAANGTGHLVGGLLCKFMSLEYGMTYTLYFAAAAYIGGILLDYGSRRLGLRGAAI